MSRIPFLTLMIKTGQLQRWTIFHLFRFANQGYLMVISWLSEDQCSLGKPNETIEGWYES